jgi:uncharacterized membrane protein
MAKVVSTSASTEAQTVKAPRVELKSNANTGAFMFTKTNYQIMIGGLLLIAIGFILMSGGRSEDPHVFNYEEIYSFRRITLAPILVILGFLTEIVAIMWLPKVDPEL